MHRPMRVPGRAPLLTLGKQDTQPRFGRCGDQWVYRRFANLGPRQRIWGWDFVTGPCYGICCPCWQQHVFRVLVPWCDYACASRAYFWVSIFQSLHWFWELTGKHICLLLKVRIGIYFSHYWFWLLPSMGHDCFQAIVTQGNGGRGTVLVMGPDWG